MNRGPLLSAPIVVAPWFVNDRGAQVYTVKRGERTIGWFTPHPCGFYGERAVVRAGFTDPSTRRLTAMPYPMSFRDFARVYTDGVNALIALGSLPHLSVNKYADPTEGERRNLNMDEVRDIAAADPSLLFVDYRTERPDAPSWWRSLIDYGATSIAEGEHGVWSVGIAEVVITDADAGPHSLCVIVDGASAYVSEGETIEHIARVARELRSQAGY